MPDLEEVPSSILGQALAFWRNSVRVGIDDVVALAATIFTWSRRWPKEKPS
jgi:hypothetical protein